MINNPIVQRELVGLLRTRKSAVMLFGVAASFALLVMIRWPDDATAGLSGSNSRQVFSVFAYGMAAILMLMVPVFPATSIVSERQRGTLALLLNTRMSPVSIYLGKLVAMLGFVGLLLVVSLPAAAACYAMGGLSLRGDIGSLYAILVLLCVQYAALGLLLSTSTTSTDSALRMTYGGVLAMAVLVLAPNYFLQGTDHPFAGAAALLRNLSPLPAIMDVLGHRQLGNEGLLSQSDSVKGFFGLGIISIVIFAVITIARLSRTMLDRSRSQGVITDDRSTGQQYARRLLFLVDPQRRKSSIPGFVNPVMVKEFRCRQFGRFHWLMRIISLCALISLGLSYATTMGALDWGVETIGGIIVVLQVALIILFTPSLAAGLISTERESGGWDLLRTTPLSAGTILRGKLMSVAWTLLLILCATLPGYAVMMYIKPILREQLTQVLICLAITAVFAILLSATVSSFFRRTAPATATSYGILLAVCAGTLLIWMGRDAPFGHSTVFAALSINPMAAALHVIGTRGFEPYDLVPVNWWIMSGVCAALSATLLIRTAILTRPE